MSRESAALKLRLPQAGWLAATEKHWTVWIAAAAFAVIAGASTWLLGGFAAAKPPALPQLEAGKGIDTGQWHVVVHTASLSARRPDGRAAASGKASLAIELELTNRTGSSSNDYATLLRIALPVIDAKTPPTSQLLLRDHTVLSSLHPKMSERIALAWDIPLATPIPDPLPVVVMSKIHKQRDNLLGGAGWFNPKPMAEVRLPVSTPDAAVAPP